MSFDDSLRNSYLVETYVNGTSWYRVYSDGWCEQGGETSTVGTQTIMLLKKMKNTNYDVVKTIKGTSSYTGGTTVAWCVNVFGIAKRNVDSFEDRTNTGFGVQGFTWKVSGYIERD